MVWAVCWGLAITCMGPLLTHWSGGTWALALSVAVGIVPLCIHCVLFLWERHRTRTWEGPSGGEGATTHEVAGCVGEMRLVARLIDRASPTVFRVGLSDPHVYGLYAVCGASIILMVVFRISAALFVLGAVVCVLGQWARRGVRYRVVDHCLLVETHLGAEGGVDKIPLEGTTVRCDFRAGCIAIRSEGTSVSIPLDGVLLPHAFAAAVLRGAGVAEQPASGSQAIA